MKPEVLKEHEWLHKLVGEWTSEGDADMGPDKPPVKWTATESARSLEGMWVVAESAGELPEGGASTTIMTLGYDPQKKSFVGTFIGSMMSNLWIYDGSLDSSGRKLTLDTEGPVFGVEGKTTKYKDVIEFRNDDERTLTSTMLGDDGQWSKVMSVTYRRKK